MSDYLMLINGEWVDSDRRFDSVDPSSGEPIGSVAEAQSSHIEGAVSAANQALPGWRKLGAAGRAQILARFVDRLRSEYEQAGENTALKRLITADMGKRLPEADIEVAESADMVEFFVNRGPSLLEDRTLELDQVLWPTKESRVAFEPVGAVGVIKPWNYPLELPLWSIAPALVAGNTVVFKPSEHSPCVGTELVKLLQEAGLPPGVMNLIHGAGDVGKLLVESSGIAMVSFTGSATAGRDIAVRCASRLARYSLELGGNDPAIVLADVDLELAANGLVWGCFANSGQVCVRPKRVFVDRKVAAELTDLILQRTRALRPDIDYGPIVSRGQLDRIDEQVRKSVAQGAALLEGGKTIDRHGGYYYAPTVLGDVTPDMTVVKEECFGPVMPIRAVDSPEEALRLANDSPFGLGASVWGSDQERTAQLAAELQAGMVWVNDVNVAFPQAPWGGVKQSGPGLELGEWGLYEFTVKKHIDFERSNSPRRDWWYPY